MVNPYSRPKSRLQTPVAEPTTVFTVLRTARPARTGEENDAEAIEKVTVRGSHPTEEQAYKAAILDFIYYLEDSEGQALPKVRAIAKTKTLGLKDRLKSIQGCQSGDSDERVEFVVQRSHVFPPEDGMDLDSLLDGRIMPCAYWDSEDDDEDEYDPERDFDEEEEGDDEEDEDEEMDLVDERDYFEGIGGSGTKDDDDEMEQTPQNENKDKNENVAHESAS
eukprot:TRINITY_DN1680_c0_g1_i1.p1 TRINITY_DN1680_c0_g1~~TRINITY_DN1680_c0_g1_i1.p1  ORF type:complete len:221 (-),score=36.53 TRINITY_DN1680_c0_g1_i1:319-981(-)